MIGVSMYTRTDRLLPLHSQSDLQGIAHGEEARLGLQNSVGALGAIRTEERSDINEKAGTKLNRRKSGSIGLSTRSHHSTNLGPPCICVSYRGCSP